MKVRIFKWMQKNHEWITIPGLLIMNIIIIYWGIQEGYGDKIYKYDFFQKLFLGTFLFFYILLIIRLAKRLYFPTLFKSIDEGSEENKGWEGLSKFQKCLLGVILFVGLSLVLVLAFAAAT